MTALALITPWLGWLLVVLFAVIMTSAAVSGAAWALQELQHKLTTDATELAIRSLGRRLAQDAHWCSEDIYSQTLLQELGSQLQNSSGFDIEQARRQARLAKEKGRP